ncbi:MAG: beta-galactosidase, partial [Micromonosporaceae bacterium]
TDVAMMREAGINYARLGDSIWALCEPADGRFELDWLEPILDALHEAGISVVLVTPTYAAPAWLCRDHPEVMAIDAQGRQARFGGRQAMNIANPTFLRYAERIIRRLLARYAEHPAVIGFQVDNETGSGFVHNDEVFEAFLGFLKERYGTVEALNEIWGLNYWSHRLSDWDELWRPAPRIRIGAGVSGNTNPGYDLQWRRFQASLVTDYLAWQATIVREYAREDQFVTHDLVGNHGRADVDRYQVAGVVDVSAENFPHATQDALGHPPTSPDDAGTGQLYQHGPAGSGPVQLSLRSDLAYGGKRSNFFITEMNPISVGGSDNTFPGYDGQWRMAAYATISRGADMVAYWHWHSLHHGSETYSHGILNHDLEPNRCYDEIARVGNELAEHGDLLTGLRPEAEVGFLYSQDSRYAFEFQPPLKTPDGRPDERSYQRIFDSCYRAFFDARAQAAVVHPAQDFAEFPVLVAPALYLADDALLRRLVGYAEAGGHLVLTFRAGYGDEHARARWQRAPGVLREAAGVSYRLYSNLATPVPLSTVDGGPALPGGSVAEGWMDELELEGAEPIVAYEHPHFGRFPAATSMRYGDGRVTYLGTLPDPAAGHAIASWVLRHAGVTPLGEGAPEPVRVTRARTRTGQRLWFISNWSFEPQQLTGVPVTGRDLFSGDPVHPDRPLRLDPWDITTLVEATP